MIDFRHEYLISTVATTLGLTNEEVTESLLEGSQVCITSLIYTVALVCLARYIKLQAPADELYFKNIK